MRNRLVAYLAVLLAAPASAEPITVMSYNLRGDFDGGVATDKPTGWLSKTGDHRRDSVLRLVRQADPDLLGVQEAYRNQVDELADALPGHVVYAVGRDDGAAAGEHCAIYYRRDRFEQLDTGTFWLSKTPETASTFPGAACPRIASWVVLRDRREPASELLVVNTHWDHVSNDARIHSAELIRERLAELAGGRPAIVMGDLNVPEESEPIRVLLGDGTDRLIDSYRTVHPERASEERTHHGFKGGREGSRIDYILHTGGLHATEAAIVWESRPSDHYPVTATLLGESR